MVGSPAHDDELVELVAEDYGTDVPLPRQYAHYTNGGKRRPATLSLTETPKLDIYALTIAVAGKAEARRIAGQRNAIVWNF
jgi:hypothetical protein